MMKIDDFSYRTSRLLTKQFSTSFYIASLFFKKDIKKDIFAIYGLVRIADEIVDNPLLIDKKKYLLELREETIQSIIFQYSVNPIVLSFAKTAKFYNFDLTEILDFFKSMKMDLKKMKYDQDSYEKYIYGSAEVVGLMCLRVFVNDDQKFKVLSPGAKKLASIYQKVNFLRDMKDDYELLGRYYFPELSFLNFSQQYKNKLVKDLYQDFKQADQYIKLLPRNCRLAVKMSRELYFKLLKKIDRSSVDDLKNSRIRINNFVKIVLIIKVSILNLFS